MAEPPEQMTTIEAAHSVRSEIVSETAAVLARLMAATERPACAVVLGERNSGKTTVVNALLADGLLPSSVLANTSYFSLVRYASTIEAASVSVSGERGVLDGSEELQDAELARIEIGLPNERLKTFEVLDTPGHIAPADVLALPWLAPVRIPLWCTVATQAWKESERLAWTSIAPSLRRHGVLVVTALDRIADDGDARRLAARLMSEAAPHFRTVAYAAPGTDIPASGLTDVMTAVSSLAEALTARRERAAGRIVRRIESLIAR